MLDDAKHKKPEPNRVLQNRRPLERKAGCRPQKQQYEIFDAGMDQRDPHKARVRAGPAFFGHPRHKQSKRQPKHDKQEVQPEGCVIARLGQIGADFRNRRRQQDRTRPFRHREPVDRGRDNDICAAACIGNKRHAGSCFAVCKRNVCIVKIHRSRVCKMGIRANREGFLRDRMQLPFQTVCLCLSIFCCFGSGVSLRALFFGSLL